MTASEATCSPACSRVSLVIEETGACYVDESVEGDSYCHDCDPRVVEKKDGRIIRLAKTCVLKALAGEAIVLDVRDPNEVQAMRGGVAISTAVNIPINVDGQAQSKRLTTIEEFKSKLEESGVLSGNQSHPFIVHCTGGGRASKAVKYLTELGFEAYNGGDPTSVREAIEAMAAKNNK